MTHPTPLTWQCLNFLALDLDQLYDLLKLRSEVFVLEQNCAYVDLDDKDRHADAHHLLGIDADGRLQAYTRLLPPGLGFAEPSFGRVITAAGVRGQGLGHQLIARSIEQVRQHWPRNNIRIGAQSHLQDLYRRHGFATASEQYLEDGIPHHEMLRLAD
jgi:ElaA protein